MGRGVEGVGRVYGVSVKGVKRGLEGGGRCEKVCRSGGK